MDALALGVIDPVSSQLGTAPQLGRDPQPSTDPQLGRERPNPAERGGIQLAPRIRAAILALLEAHEYGQDLERTDWDFALEIGSLRQMNLSNSDLRWLVGRGVIDHAVEVTAPGDPERCFRQSSRLLFLRRTCFVITPQGIALAPLLRDGAELADGLPRLQTTTERPRTTWELLGEPLVPKWDRDRQQLRVGSVVVKQFKVPAPNQETILAALEEESWPSRIDDPLPPHPDQTPKRRLQETIKSLNRNQRRSIVRFLGDGSGEGVRWEFRNQSVPGSSA